MYIWETDTEKLCFFLSGVKQIVYGGCNTAIAICDIRVTDYKGNSSLRFNSLYYITQHYCKNSMLAKMLKLKVSLSIVYVAFTFANYGDVVAARHERMCLTCYYSACAKLPFIWTARNLTQRC